jgi:hypothetical protein
MMESWNDGRLNIGMMEYWNDGDGMMKDCSDGR